MSGVNGSLVFLFVLFCVILEYIACFHVRNEMTYSICNLNSSFPLTYHRSSSNIVVVSDSSWNALDYALYSFRINSYFAVQKGYSYDFYAQERWVNFEPFDNRWNKVRLLYILISTELEKYKVDSTDKYLFWIDSDAFLVNLEFDFDNIVTQAPFADIIISAELHAETGVANTGCFLIKCSRWSLLFLEMWFDNYDRHIAHDQIFFDVLYKSLDPANKSHIVILPCNSINSCPPVVSTYKDTDNVVHLMGVHNDIRKAVAVDTLTRLCSDFQWVNGEIDLESSIISSERKSNTLISQSRLASIYIKEYFSLLGPAVRSIRDEKLTNIDKLTYVSASREYLLHLSELINYSENSHDRNKYEAYTQLMFAAILALELDYRKNNIVDIPLMSQMQVYQLISLIGNDILQWNSHFDHENRFECRLQYLDLLCECSSLLSSIRTKEDIFLLIDTSLKQLIAILNEITRSEDSIGINEHANKSSNNIYDMSAMSQMALPFAEMRMLHTVNWARYSLLLLMNDKNSRYLESSRHRVSQLLDSAYKQSWDVLRSHGNHYHVISTLTDFCQISHRLNRSMEIIVDAVELAIQLTEDVLLLEAGQQIAVEHTNYLELLEWYLGLLTETTTSQKNLLERIPLITLKIQQLCQNWQPLMTRHLGNNVHQAWMKSCFSNNEVSTSSVRKTYEKPRSFYRKKKRH